MGTLAESSTEASVQAAVQERTAASDAIQAQHSSDAGARVDTAATQIPSRGLEFNPGNETVPAAGTSGAQPGATAAGASGVSSEYEGALDYARGRGLDVTGFADDGALMNALVERYHRGTQEDYHAQLGRQLLPHVPAIQKYLQQQAAPTAAATPEWEAPPFDERWGQMVERDPMSGVYLGKPGCPPEIVAAVNKHVDYQRKYASNPLAAVRPYVEQTLPTMIEKMVEARISAYQRDQTVQSIVQRNSGWMYQQDAQGRVQMGVGGRPVPTPHGMRYSQHVQYLEAQGMRDPSAVDQLARQLTIGEMSTATAAQHVAGNPAAAQQQAALASGRQQTNVLQSLTADQRAVTPGATEPEGGGSLHERLKAALDANGFTDADFQDLDLMR